MSRSKLVPNSPQMSRLERLISYFAPQWAANRAMYRAAGEQLASFRGARHTRVGRSFPTGGSPDYHLEATQDRRELVDRARQLERNSVIAEGLLSRSVENVVGCGFRLQAQSASDQWNKRVEERWNDWCEFEADVRGMATLNDMLALTFRSWLRDGDVGTLLLADGKLQTIESDQIASPSGAIPTKELIDGIRLDPRGRPTHYLVVTDPDPQWSTVRYQEYKEIPAENMLFIARRQRLNQTRGLSAFSNIAWLLDQIDGSLEAVTVAQRMAACIGLVINRKGRMAGLPTATGASGSTYRKLSLEPGMIYEGNEGDQVSQINPSQPATNMPEFLNLLGRLAGLSFGLPLELAFLNFENVNYSSARASLLQAHQVWRCHQEMLRRFMGRIFRWWLVNEMDAGRVRARADALKHSWITPGWKWVDPEKELKAQLAAVDAGVLTLSDIALQQGRDFPELVETRKSEIELIREAGLPEVRSPMTRDPMPAKEEQGDVTRDEMQQEMATFKRELLESQRHRETLGALSTVKADEPKVVNNNFHMPAKLVAQQPAPVVNYTPPEQPAPVVHVHAAEQPAPVVNMAAPDAPAVVVQVPEQPAPVVNVQNDVHVETPARNLKILRGEDGQIVGGEVE